MLQLNKIHSDARGSINSLLGDLLQYPEVAIFETKKGYARGGCIHSQSCEHICVLSGEIHFIYEQYNGPTLQPILKEVKLLAGQSLTIPPMTPHYFLAKSDSIVMEWGPQMEEKNERHLAFRKIVDAINSKNI
jgi:mannose-6-phosphate isomerase-like protein (cupin superfamily)